jgi:hypothetical protein
MSGQGCSVTHKRDQEGPPLASYKKSHNPFDALSDDEDEDDDEPIISVTDGIRNIPSDTNGRREKGKGKALSHQSMHHGSTKLNTRAHKTMPSQKMFAEQID